MRLLTIVLLCGCGIDPFETPSAYDQQRYLCGDPESLDSLKKEAATCRNNPAPCEGYISFQGQIQKVQLRVDTTLERGTVRVVTETEPKDTGKDSGTKDSDTEKAQYLSRVEISGAAPYFHFDTAISSIGTPWPDKPTALDPGFTVTFDAPDPDNAPNLDDDHGAVQWYIRAGSDSAMLSSNPFDPKDKDPGTITVTYVSEDEVDLQFAGPLGPAGDSLDACAIVFPPTIDFANP